MEKKTKEGNQKEDFLVRVSQPLHHCLSIFNGRLLPLHSSRMEIPEPDQGQRVSVPSSSSSPSSSQVQDEENNRPQNGDDISDEQSQHNHIEQQPQQQQHQQRISRIFTYHVNLLVSDVAASEMKDDVWSCLVVLVTFWFFASMTLILGFYGSADLKLGPNCSLLIQPNPFFVQSIKAQELDEPKPGPMLYGFHNPPPLDVEIAWTETHDTLVPANYHKEWIYFLNKGSRIDIFYRVKPTSSLPLTLVVAQGSESMAEWIEDPSYGNATLSWNIIYESGKIQQEIPKSSYYYIAVGNLNPESVEVELEFNIKSVHYNTTKAYYKCFLDNQLCSLKLSLLGASAVVITSPGPKEGVPDDDWYIRLSYGPRWVMYFLGSGVMTVLLLMAFRFCNIFQNPSEDRTEFQAGEAESEQTPLLSPKDDDVLSWGSSYESVSNNEEDLEESLEVSSLVGKSINEGDNNNTRRLCVICFDGPRDCFFLPCGHCAACFTCGTRIAEEAGTCPICRRRMKKVRKIFTV
ncbi:unnamed protein product [Prunus armeniaca]|uniref:RING-type domain-containing protein n=1 Tax=Prunus armeniaca TaxID=36596 RepID=A0A6J5V255_PRUAR|nr:unnamed protein product [Prunus armeniaca]